MVGGYNEKRSVRSVLVLKSVNGVTCNLYVKPTVCPFVIVKLIRAVEISTETNEMDELRHSKDLEPGCGIKTTRRGYSAI